MNVILKNTETIWYCYYIEVYIIVGLWINELMIAAKIIELSDSIFNIIIKTTVGHWYPRRISDRLEQDPASPYDVYQVIKLEPCCYVWGVSLRFADTPNQHRANQYKLAVECTERQSKARPR